MDQASDSSDPVGQSAAVAAQQHASPNAAYRQQRDELAATRELARQLILFRTRRELSQQALAEMVATSHSHISRIESGRYMPAGKTLQRIARALDLDLRIRFEEKGAAVRHGAVEKA